MTRAMLFCMFAPSPVPIKLPIHPNFVAYRSRRRKESRAIPQKSKIAAPSQMDASSIQRLYCARCVLHLLVILPRVIRLLRVLRVLRVPVMCLSFRLWGTATVLHLLRILQIQRNRLWTWLEGEDEESEEEEEEETAHGTKQARGAMKKPKQEEVHSDGDPEDNPVVPEKGSFAKAVRSTMLEIKQEPQTMAEKKKRRSEERSPPKVRPKKSEAEMPKKKKDKDKAASGQVSFAISGKGPQKSISAALTRAAKFQQEGGYDRDLDTMQTILQTDFNASLGRLVTHYKECLLAEPKSRRQIGLAVLLHTSVQALRVQSVLRCATKNAQSAATTREYFEKPYPLSSPRQVAEGLLK